LPGIIFQNVLIGQDDDLLTLREIFGKVFKLLSKINTGFASFGFNVNGAHFKKIGPLLTSPEKRGTNSAVYGKGY
jgi:hypothetical protein